MNDHAEVNSDPTGSDAPGIVVRHRLPWVIAAVIGVPLLVITLYAGLVLHWSYSQGARAGVLQKFSRKGWIIITGMEVSRILTEGRITIS